MEHFQGLYACPKQKGTASEKVTSKLKDTEKRFKKNQAGQYTAVRCGAASMGMATPLIVKLVCSIVIQI